MLAAGVSSSAGFDRHHNDAVHDGFGDLRGTQSFLIIRLADRVASVGDHNHHFSSLPGFERLGAYKNGVIERSGRTHRHSFDTAVDRLQVRSEWDNLVHELANSID